ncbi:DeoR/GlpR family DNA-binding transcription regulator [Streptomyces sp. NPDC005438]|uniref:DeoR/GlpR family DNA-binding transcription regulator n=1 Tax=Streptomyces sp. NPDC005438 TaxID=3156880 RepID=UPI0033BFB21C
MAKQERWTALLELLAERGRLEVEDAAATLEVSPATIRRDLDELAAQHMLTRTRGGATAHGVSYELPMRYKSSQHAPEKQRIARAVADLVSPGEVVGLNGGTTTTEVARALALQHAPHPAGNHQPPAPQGPALTLVTNALNIATELAVRPHIKIVATGGVARPQTYELTGPLTAGVLDQVNLDTTVLGVDGLTGEQGLMTHHEDEAAISRLFIRRAHRVIVATHASKIGHRAFTRVCDLDQVDHLVTDTSLTAEQRGQLADSGVEITTV